MHSDEPAGAGKSAVNHLVTPGNIGVKQKVGEAGNFANRPQGGHPNGYEQKKA
jgi:hypothetical protein